MDEFELIRRFFTPGERSDSVILGVGDDGAVLRPEPGLDLIAVVDMLVENVHFPRHMPAADIAYRAVVANVSDIAAMGGRPRWMTMALTLRDAEADWLEAFSRGTAESLRRFDVELVGGDITHGGDIVVSVQIIGDIAPGRAVTRSGAQPGDGIYVSGTPGDAAAGLSLLQKPVEDSARHPWMDYLIGRFSRPEPRVLLGQALPGLANAAIDVSDGLYSDLAKLIDASGVAAVIEVDDIPLSDELRSGMGHDEARRFALGGGEDFELCFTSSKDLGAEADIGGVRVTRIGKTGTGTGLTCTMSGDPFDYRDEGYRHFH